MPYMTSTPTAEWVPRLINEAEFLASTNRSASSIAKALTTGALFFVVRDGERLYPNFFSDPSLERRQLVEVSKLLMGLDGFTRWQFFVTGKGSLGGLTPLEGLRRRKFQRVRDTARGFAER
jgi:hypothetical protein